MYSKPKHKVRLAEMGDITEMVNLSYKKRLAYQAVQPQFWKHAEDAEAIQEEWFKSLLESETHVLLVAESQLKMEGFIIGQMVPAPEVYNPGGLTLMIDDFCVADSTLWETVGKLLLSEIKARVENKDVSQVLVVSGAHDTNKRSFLAKVGLSLTSEWYVGKISE